jgi:hypothetical protein
MESTIIQPRSLQLEFEHRFGIKGVIGIVVPFKATMFHLNYVLALQAQIQVQTEVYILRA